MPLEAEGEFVAQDDNKAVAASIVSVTKLFFQVTAFIFLIRLLELQSSKNTLSLLSNDAIYQIAYQLITTTKKWANFFLKEVKIIPFGTMN